jgi:hypothetical protein
MKRALLAARRYVIRVPAYLCATVVAVHIFFPIHARAEVIRPCVSAVTPLALCTATMR